MSEYEESRKIYIGSAQNGMHFRGNLYENFINNKNLNKMESPNMKELRKVGWSGAKFSIVAEYESVKEMWKAEEELIKEHSQNPNCLNSKQHDDRIRKVVQKIIRTEILVNQRCGKCKGCENWRKKIDCKICKFCKDKKRYGGTGKLRKICIEQYCMLCPTLLSVKFFR